jgi:hypothetical protein
VILRGVSFRSMPAPTDLALILRQWRSRPMARSSRLPASRHGAGVGAVAQWRKMAQEGRPIRRNRCETGISRGDDT